MQARVRRNERARIITELSIVGVSGLLRSQFATDFGAHRTVASDAISLRQMNDGASRDLAGRWDRSGDAYAALGRIFGAGVRPLRLEAALFDALLEGWRRAQGGRHLTEG